MKKKNIKVIVSVMMILLLACSYFLLFTFNGQQLIYAAFGGNNLHLTAQDKELFWFDAQHVNDPSHPMFRRIENAFVKFSPDLVLVEGGFDTFEDDRESAMQKGESAFTAHLSKQAGIPVMDIEPPFHNQIEYLQSKYQPKDILAMYLVRQISSGQFALDNSHIDFEQMLTEQTGFLTDNGLAFTGKSPEDILELINAYLPEPINENNWKDVDIRAMNYVFTKEDGPLYPIYSDVFNYRNSYLIDLLGEKQKQYKKIFIMMGGAHLAETKERLQELYSD